MSNPLFNQFGVGNPMGALLQQYNQFKSTFSGNAQQQVQQLLNSGRMSQQQYNALVARANQIAPLLGIKK